MSLWPHQEQAVAASLAAFDAGIRRQLIVMATGTGKTRTFGEIIDRLHNRLPGQTMVLAHTKELVQQNYQSLLETNPTSKIGIEMAGQHAAPDCDVISASVQTVGREGSERLSAFPNVTKFVIDEAHHTPSAAYNRVLEHADVLKPSTSRFVLGVTATSSRPDGAALSDYFDRVVYTYGIRSAISDGRLVPVRGYRVTTDTALDSVGQRNGDFVVSELSKVVDTPKRNGEIVRRWKELGRSRPTLAFTADISHAQNLAVAFREAGIEAQAIWGDDPLREHKLKEFRDGKIKVLCNCALLTEGFDAPMVSCIVLGRPTASGLLYTQMVGRGTRLAEGKADLIVLDIVDNTNKHSLATLPTLMGLSRNLDLEGKDLVEVVETIEVAERDHPNIPFDKLTKVSELATFIEKVDLFNVRFPEEVEANSALTWFKAADGGFKITIPKKGEPGGFVRIREDSLAQWHVTGEIDGAFAGVRSTMEKAFKLADEVIRQRVNPMALQCILREAAWHGKPVTNGQKKMLERLFPWKQFDYSLMNSGQASKLISERIGRKK